MYDQNLRSDQVGDAGGSNSRYRVLADTEWYMILVGRTVLLSDFNGHTP